MLAQSQIYSSMHSKLEPSYYDHVLAAEPLYLSDSDQCQKILGGELGFITRCADRVFTPHSVSVKEKTFCSSIY